MCSEWCWSTGVPRSHSFVPMCFLWHLSWALCCPSSSGWGTWDAAGTELQLSRCGEWFPPWFLQLAPSTDERTGQDLTWGVRVGPSLGSVQHELLLCSCCSSSPGSGVQHHLYSDFWCSEEAVFSVLRYWAGSKQSTKPTVHQVDPKSKNNLLETILCYTNISQNCDLILNI